MSRVLLIAADKPLPFCDFQEMRTKNVTIPSGEQFQISAPAGFLVEEHSYYRHAVDELHLHMKPYQFEFSLEAVESDLLHLKTYLTDHLIPGDEIELWNLWVGIDRSDFVCHERRTLTTLDMEAIGQLLNTTLANGKFDQFKMTISI